jgi:hypothetical protein
MHIKVAFEKLINCHPPIHHSSTIDGIFCEIRNHWKGVVFHQTDVGWMLKNDSSNQSSWRQGIEKWPIRHQYL